MRDRELTDAFDTTGEGAEDRKTFLDWLLLSSPRCFRYESMQRQSRGRVEHGRLCRFYLSNQQSSDEYARFITVQYPGGWFKINLFPFGETVIVNGPTLLKELCNAPEEALSFRAFAKKVLLTQDRHSFILPLLSI